MSKFMALASGNAFCRVETQYIYILDWNFYGANIHDANDKYWQAGNNTCGRIELAEFFCCPFVLLLFG